MFEDQFLPRCVRPVRDDVAEGDRRLFVRPPRLMALEPLPGP